MSQYEMFAKLKHHVNLLRGLLEEPEPGLFTWCSAVATQWKAISDLWKGTADAKH